MWEEFGEEPRTSVKGRCPHTIDHIPYVVVCACIKSTPTIHINTQKVYGLNYESVLVVQRQNDLQIWL